MIKQKEKIMICLALNNQIYQKCLMILIHLIYLNNFEFRDKDFSKFGEALDIEEVLLIMVLDYLIFLLLFLMEILFSSINNDGDFNPIEEFFFWCKRNKERNNENNNNRKRETNKKRIINQKLILKENN